MRSIKFDQLPTSCDAPLYTATSLFDRCLRLSTLWHSSLSLSAYSPDPPRSRPQKSSTKGPLARMPMRDVTLGVDYEHALRGVPYSRHTLAPIDAKKVPEYYLNIEIHNNEGPQISSIHQPEFL